MYSYEGDHGEFSVRNDTPLPLTVQGDAFADRKLMD